MSAKPKKTRSAGIEAKIVKFCDAKRRTPREVAVKFTLDLKSTKEILQKLYVDSRLAWYPPDNTYRKKLS